MPDADRHGVRRTYQRGCRCPACTTANQRYIASYRAARREGRPPLGAHVAGDEAAKAIAALLEEGYLKRDIATALGHRWPVLHWRPGAGVTLRTTLRLRKLVRRTKA